MTPWVLDPTHSTIQFSVRHMMVSNVRGTFGEFALEVGFDPDHPELGHVTATVQAASIDTRQEQRDTHLRSADFLDATGFPTLVFTSTGIVPREHGRYALNGDLAIRGVTKPVTFDAEFIGEVVNAQGGRSAGFSATTRIRRSEWGLTWNMGLEAGGLVVSDEVKVEVDIELVRAAEVVVPEPVVAGAA
jgi:polyisoprenoid-binding protein YceI